MSQTYAETETAAGEPAGFRVVSLDDYAFILEGYRTLMDAGPVTETHLRQAVLHVVQHPGSLIRAQLAFHIMAGHGVERDRARAVAVALEYFHTASLVFDDMPSMDDARLRRGTPCVHVAFGEAAATLCALGFINRGYHLLWEAAAALPETRRGAASRLVHECLGLAGILNGQSKDLNFRHSSRAAADALEVAAGKTVTLIRLSLVLPAMVGGAPAPVLAQLDTLSQWWGLSYQAMDDFKDCLMSSAETGKTAARDHLLQRPNLPACLGHAEASALLGSLMARAGQLVCNLADQHVAWTVLARLQELMVEECARIQQRIAAALAA